MKEKINEYYFSAKRTLKCYKILPEKYYIVQKHLSMSPIFQVLTWARKEAYR